MWAHYQTPSFARRSRGPEWLTRTPTLIAFGSWRTRRRCGKNLASTSRAFARSTTKQLYANYRGWIARPAAALSGARGRGCASPRVRPRCTSAASPRTSRPDDPSQEALLSAGSATSLVFSTIGPSDPNHFEVARGSIPPAAGAPGTFIWRRRACKWRPADSAPAWLQSRQDSDLAGVDGDQQRSAPAVGQASRIRRPRADSSTMQSPGQLIQSRTWRSPRLKG